MNQFITRRKFIGQLALASLSSSLPRFKPKINRLSFLGVKDKELVPYTLARAIIPIGPEKSLEKGSEEYEELKGRAVQQLDMGGLEELVISSQDYAMTTSKEIIDDTLDYCKKAEEFLYAIIRGLDKLPINWTPLKAGQKFDNDWDKRAFIGIQRVTISKFLNGEKDTGIVNTELSTGSMCQIDYDFDTNNYNGWYIFISSNRAALHTPFSEIIPLTTHKKALQYSKRVGLRQAIVSEEAISESVAYKLAGNMIREIGMSHLQFYLDNKYLSLIKSRSRYSMLMPALKLINKVGCQAAFDLYMESPERYLETLKVMDS